MITTTSDKELYQLAMAAGRDAADRNMRQDGRTEWSAEDLAIAYEVFSETYHPATGR